MTCECGRELPPPKPVGRPRKRCEACAANKSALAKAWRQQHPEVVAKSNASKRSKSQRAQAQAYLDANRDRLIRELREQAMNAKKGEPKLTHRFDYAKCEWCEQAMAPGTACTTEKIIVDGEHLARIPFGSEQLNGWEPEVFDRPCHDCNVMKGQLHHPVCDMEQCPGCRGQLISCGCDVEDIEVVAA